MKAGLAPGEGADRQTKWVDHHGGVAIIMEMPNTDPPLFSPPGTSRKQTSTFSCLSLDSVYWVPCLRLAPGSPPWPPPPSGHEGPPAPPVPAPRSLLVPLFPGPGANPETGTPSPPMHICLLRTSCHFFGVYRFCFPGRSQRKTPPRVMGPKPKNFKPIFGRAVSRTGHGHVQPREHAEP